MNSAAVTRLFHGAGAAGATMDSAEGAERRTCSNECTFSHFQILMNSAAVARLFHGTGAAGAAMDPAEGTRCRCRRYKVPLQSVAVQSVVRTAMDNGCTLSFISKF